MSFDVNFGTEPFHFRTQGEKQKIERIARTRDKYKRLNPHQSAEVINKAAEEPTEEERKLLVRCGDEQSGGGAATTSSQT